MSPALRPGCGRFLQRPQGPDPSARVWDEREGRVHFPGLQGAAGAEGLGGGVEEEGELLPLQPRGPWAALQGGGGAGICRACLCLLPPV